ncbi:ABC transporter permease [Bacillus cereus]|uniref:Putative ABC transporter permease protein n=1 Tax=Bacillus cereus TaxID=1396 RepID=A0A162PIU6_BACCE|nr:ABC transporter permease [Bacillus cereus]KZD72159.1 putative ABC transporter permease protein [Bacillus cereus]
MIKLIQNEFMKMHAKKTLYYLLGFMFIVQIVVGVIIRKWVPELTKGSFLDLASRDLSIISFIATMYGITLGRKVISEEFQTGTIKQLLIRPKKRMTILLSKYITVLLVIVLFGLLALMSSMIVGVCVMDGGSTELTFIVLMKMFLYKLPKAFFFATLAFFIANIFTKSVISLIIPIVFHFSTVIFEMALLNYAKDFAEYFITFHYNLSVYDSNKLINAGLSPEFPGYTFAKSLLIVVTYCVAMVSVACVIFKKRDIR